MKDKDLREKLNNGQWTEDEYRYLGGIHPFLIKKGVTLYEFIVKQEKELQKLKGIVAELTDDYYSE